MRAQIAGKGGKTEKILRVRQPRGTKKKKLGCLVWTANPFARLRLSAPALMEAGRHRRPVFTLDATEMDVRFSMP